MISIPKKRITRWLLIIMGALAATGGAFMFSACAAVGKAPSGNALELLKKSTNYKDGEFVNGIPAEDPSFFKAFKEWAGGAENTTPNNPVPVVERDSRDFADPPLSGLQITWIGHSTSLVVIDGVRLLLDPVWSERSSPFSNTGPKRFYPAPLALEDLPPVDAVLISHDHYDHLDMETVKKLGEKGYRFIVPLGVGSRLRSWDIPEGQIEELDWWDGTRVKNITVTATPARHFSGRSLVMADRNETLWAGFAMVGAEHRVYYTGDTGMFPGFVEIGKRLGPFDATLVEVGAYNRLWADLHLGPEQAVQAVVDARGGLMIPVHWGTFNLALHSWVEPVERAIVAADRHNVPLAIPKPGQSIEPSNPPKLIRWWPDIPWQTEQEHPIVSSGLASE